MNKFVRLPANKASVANRRPVFGVGINDSDYITNPVINGERVVCPAYRAWKGMIKRCYSSKLHEKHPTYKDCSVCKEWLTFSNFEKWHRENIVTGYHLDKDIKIVGNRVYSPDTCMFIPPSVNMLFCDCASKRGGCPVGVNVNSHSGRFIARVMLGGERVYLGTFNSKDDAFNAYKKAKNQRIMDESEKHPSLKKYLLNHIYG